MATYTVVSGKHATLVANVVDIVNINPNGISGTVRFKNRGATRINITYGVKDGPAAPDPVVDGDDTIIMGNGDEFVIDRPPFAVTQIRLISSGNVAYSVEVAIN